MAVEKPHDRPAPTSSAIGALGGLVGERGGEVLRFNTEQKKEQQRDAQVTSLLRRGLTITIATPFINSREITVPERTDVTMRIVQERPRNNHLHGDDVVINVIASYTNLENDPIKGAERAGTHSLFRIKGLFTYEDGIVNSHVTYPQVNTGEELDTLLWQADTAITLFEQNPHRQ